MGATSNKSTVTTCCTGGITEAEWEALPVTFGASTMARILHTNVRWVQNHPEKLGGRKVAGRWLFSKARVAEFLDL